MSLWVPPAAHLDPSNQKLAPAIVGELPVLPEFTATGDMKGDSVPRVGPTNGQPVTANW